MSIRQMWHDERAIEGLPIRLVIALVVGVASLAVMMNVISGLEVLGATELDTQPEPEIIGEGQNQVEVTVVDSDGEPVEDATVVAKGDSAQISEIVTAETDENGVATLTIDPQLRPNQDEGTIVLDIRPPGGDYVDEQENTDILVLADE